MRDLILEFESRQGWLRTNSPPFNEMKFDITFYFHVTGGLFFLLKELFHPTPELNIYGAGT